MNEQTNNHDSVSRSPSTGDDVGRVPPHGAQDEPLPRRLRRLHRVWPDRDGNISYLLTICVDGRARVLDNEDTFQRMAGFLLDSSQRYRWFGRRFVIMPDHIHLIAHMGYEAVRLGQWIKAFKSVVGGLEQGTEGPVRAPGLQVEKASSSVDRPPTTGVPVGRVSSHGVTVARVPPRGVGLRLRDAGVGHVPSRGVVLPLRRAVVGPVPPPGAGEGRSPSRGSAVGRVPPRGVPQANEGCAP